MGRFHSLNQRLQAQGSAGPSRWALLASWLQRPCVCRGLRHRLAALVLTDQTRCLILTNQESDQPPGSSLLCAAALCTLCARVTLHSLCHLCCRGGAARLQSNQPVTSTGFGRSAGSSAAQHSRSGTGGNNEGRQQPFSQQQQQQQQRGPGGRGGGGGGPGFGGGGWCEDAAAESLRLVAEFPRQQRLYVLFLEAADSHRLNSHLIRQGGPARGLTEERAQCCMRCRCCSPLLTAQPGGRPTALLAALWAGAWTSSQASKQPPRLRLVLRATAGAWPRSSKR